MTTEQTLNTTANETAANQHDTQAALNNLLGAGCASTISDLGSGCTVLVLHGGGGTATVAGMAHALATTARVLMPTHPGFDGTARPEHLGSVAELAHLYLQLLEALDLRNVLVVGSSIGGWAAAAMALADRSGRINGLVLLNPVGIQVSGAPLTDVSGLSRPELVRLASHNPDLIMANAPPPTPERMAMLASNANALAAYDNGQAMMVPGLREQLATVNTPTLVLWGESDGIASTAYGQAYAAAFANARFETIPEAGHLPHIEQPARVLQHIAGFMQKVDAATTA